MIFHNEYKYEANVKLYFISGIIEINYINTSNNNFIVGIKN